MPRKKSEKNPKEKNKKEIPVKKLVEELSIEKEGNDKISEEDKSELEEQLNAASGSVSNQEMSRILSNLSNSRGSTLEQIQSTDDLEGAVIFAPRGMTRGPEIELKDYSASNYEANMYNESKYEEKTPGFYSGKSSSDSGSSDNGSSGEPGK